MRTGRPKRPLMLEAANHDKLELLARQPKIVLRATERLSNQEIARRLGVTGATVGKWRERYRVQGMRFIG
jgi:DNA-binding transcriptional regulator YiaG